MFANVINKVLVLVCHLNGLFCSRPSVYGKTFFPLLHHLPFNHFIGNSYDASLRLNGVHDILVGKVSYRPDPELFYATKLPCSSTSTAGSRTTATVQIPVRSSFLLCVSLT